jgi:hypothetical protein
MRQESDEVFGLEVVGRRSMPVRVSTLKGASAFDQIEHPNLEMCLVLEAARKANRD